MYWPSWKQRCVDPLNIIWKSLVIRSQVIGKCHQGFLGLLENMIIFSWWWRGQKDNEWLRLQEWIDSWEAERNETPVWWHHGSISQRFRQKWNCQPVMQASSDAVFAQIKYLLSPCDGDSGDGQHEPLYGGAQKARQERGADVWDGSREGQVKKLGTICKKKHRSPRSVTPRHIIKIIGK